MTFKQIQSENIQKYYLTLNNDKNIIMLKPIKRTFRQLGLYLFMCLWVSMCVLACMCVLYIYMWCPTGSASLIEPYYSNMQFNKDVLEKIAELDIKLVNVEQQWTRIFGAISFTGLKLFSSLRDQHLQVNIKLLKI